MANATQITQVLSNLIINAADAMATAGTIELHVDTIQPDAAMLGDFAREGVLTQGESVLTTTQGSLNPKSRYVRFTIADHGSGIAAAVFAHIFEPFFTTKDKSRGTGLGLAVVAGIVEAHRGAIRVVTRPGAGTKFEVFIPRAEGHSAALVAPKIAAAAAKKGLRGHERVLIVDDESDLAEALGIALGRLGYETVPIFHPLEALEIFSEDPTAWDVVISDQSMPKLKGLELIRQLRALRPELKAIVCTGFSDALDADRAVLEGIDAFFHKPVTAETLARTIRGLFG
jgi:CheY-like chemotaxis protein